MTSELCEDCPPRGHTYHARCRECPRREISPELDKELDRFVADRPKDIMTDE